ncbi:hypothetical protein SAMN04488597_10949 [Halanaerobium congolense]|uniref:Uncharacterized protein n=1 Tax=Halanaerobium congolense TaxID=54121 RepID=A0A1G6MT91_9FIRM|nr:hypothetical protein SAMN04488597_10949 [Halanaerobium congolense]
MPKTYDPNEKMEIVLRAIKDKKSLILFINMVSAATPSMSGKMSY